MMREKKDIKPVLLKFGVVLAFSLGGILYSIVRIKRVKLSRSPSSKSQPSSEQGNQVDSGVARAELGNDDDHVLQKGPCSCHFSSIEPGKDEETSPSRSNGDNCACNFSPSKRSDGGHDVYLLPEFNDLVKEFDLNAIKASFSPCKDVETPVLNAETNKHIENGDHEEEFRNLRKFVKNLKENEGSLEIQLLESYGLKEQETAVTELQNRLKINNMEAKLLNLKIESLQADKKRLEEEVAYYAKIVSEQVVQPQKEENKGPSIDSDVQLKLQKLNDVEEEAEDLRKSNHSLRLENSELAEKLEYLQNLTISVLEDDQTEVLKEESQQNEDLTREIERLQADRCSDIEELVYVRWINACLRYELRNYQPGPGKTVARDLSKSLSPKSEEKAKQLILEYAQKEGTGEKRISIVDFDSDQWSCSSFVADSGEYDDSSVDNSSHNKTNTSGKSKTNTSGKSKIFGKLWKVLCGKESHHHKRSSSLEAPTTNEGMAARSSSASLRYNSGVSPGMGFGSDGLNIRSRTSSQGSSSVSLDLQRSPYLQGSNSNKGEDSNCLEGLQRNGSGDVSSCVYRAIGTISERGADSPQEDIQKSELVKYAEALKDSQRQSSFGRRCASFSSF